MALNKNPPKLLFPDNYRVEIEGVVYPMGEVRRILKEHAASLGWPDKVPKLEPCPCGGEVGINATCDLARSFGSIECPRCHMVFTLPGPGRTTEVIALWNRIHAPKTAAPTAGYDLVAHLMRQREFSLKTFGPGARTKGVVDHLRKELVEIEETGGAVLEEWIDAVLLALDGAWRCANEISIMPEAIVRAVAVCLERKLTKNENREWPDWRNADRDVAIEHVRSPEPNTATEPLLRLRETHPVPKPPERTYAHELRQTRDGSLFCPECGADAKIGTHRLGCRFMPRGEA